MLGNYTYTLSNFNMHENRYCMRHSLKIEIDMPLNVSYAVTNRYRTVHYITHCHRFVVRYSIYQSYRPRPFNSFNYLIDIVISIL